eukprot:scaffold12976_cov197-Amphora_coffeaeformis.AAC.9
MATVAVESAKPANEPVTTDRGEWPSRTRLLPGSSSGKKRHLRSKKPQAEQSALLVDRSNL